MDTPTTTPLFPTTYSAKASVALSHMMGSAGGDFTSVFESLLTASRNNALSSRDPRLALVPAQSKLQQQTTLFNIFSGKYSTKSYSFGMLSGFSDAFSLPAWVWDVERVMGDDKVSGLLNLQRQMAYLTTSRLGGSSSYGNVFSSLI
jgi:hypothetical protein